MIQVLYHLLGSRDEIRRKHRYTVWKEMMRHFGSWKYGVPFVAFTVGGFYLLNKVSKIIFGYACFVAF